MGKILQIVCFYLVFSGTLLGGVTCERVFSNMFAVKRACLGLCWKRTSEYREAEWRAGNKHHRLGLAFAFVMMDRPNLDGGGLMDYLIEGSDGSCSKVKGLRSLLSERSFKTHRRMLLGFVSALSRKEYLAILNNLRFQEPLFERTYWYDFSKVDLINLKKCLLPVLHELAEGLND